MQQESLLRLAISLDDQAPKTLEKYICLLIEYCLFTSSEGSLTLPEISSAILTQFGLQFDVSEIHSAVVRKSKNTLIIQQGSYSLSAKKYEQLKSQTDMGMLLRSFILEYNAVCNNTIDEQAFYSLMTRYLYYCFNSNTNNLIDLFKGHNGKVLQNFPASNEEIDFINGFVSWPNDSKNKFLYSIISFSYEYCMLTTKRDAMLSRRIFSGKRFFLDANLIFRLAGLNRDDRKSTISNFVSKCEEVGIDLLYTSDTLLEVHRVISGQVKFIQSITQNQAPIGQTAMEALCDKYQTNDIYNIYLSWSRQDQNKYYDFVSFQQYLSRKVQEVFSTLKYVDISSFRKDESGFERNCRSLKAHKQDRRPNRIYSHESVQADINNIEYILSLRTKSNQQNLWQTNDFLVSADQLLIEWVQGQYNGIPIVVLPSVWLSIILRFSGRTADDYKSFCSFLCLRHHRNQDTSVHPNPLVLLRALSQKTSDKNIKERIIFEIIQNKEQYSFSGNEESSQSTEKAFDKVLQQVRQETGESIEALKLELKQEAEKTAALGSEITIQKELEVDQTLTRIASAKVLKATKHFVALKQIFPVIDWILIFLGCLILILTLCRNGLLLSTLIPKAYVSIEAQLSFISIIIGALGGLYNAFKRVISYLASNIRQQKLYKSYYEQLKNESTSEISDLLYLKL